MWVTSVARFEAVSVLRKVKRWKNCVNVILIDEVNKEEKNPFVETVRAILTSYDYL